MDASYIVVEGPIGVGKTTLARRLAQTLGGETLLEAPQENPFLPRFYENPRAHALSTQLFFLLQRAEQMREFAQRDMFAAVQVADFMLEKDRLFAELTLEHDEFELYSGSWLRPLNFEFSYAPTQGAGIEIQDSGCAIAPFNFPTGFLKHPKNIVPLDLFEPDPLVFCQFFDLRGRQFFRQLQRGASGIDDCPFNHIFQLPDVAGPGIGL